MINTTTSQENKTIVRRARALWNEQNLTVMDELYAPAYMNYALAVPLVRTREDLKQWARKIFKVLPDIRVTVKEPFSGGHTITEFWTVQGTYRGEPLTLSGEVTYRLASGKIGGC